MNSTPQIFRERLINGRLSHFTKEDVIDFDKKFHEISLWHKGHFFSHYLKPFSSLLHEFFITK